MTAASYHQHQYFNHSPLKILNRDDTNYACIKIQNIAKRKSAVELLQETKPLYVKSEIVLDHKQELRRSSRDYPQTPTYQEEHSSSVCTSGVTESIPLPKSPRLIPPPPAFRKSTCSLQLQNKLRKLLNTNSKENLFDSSSASENSDNARCVTNTTNESELDDNLTPKVATTGTVNRYDRDHSINNFTYYKSLPDLTEAVSIPSEYTDQRNWNSTLCSASSDELCKKSVHTTGLSWVSCKNDCLHASNKSDESRNNIDSEYEDEPDEIDFRKITSPISQTLPVSPTKSCSSYITPPLLYCDANKLQKNQPVSRSKSDVGTRNPSSLQFADLMPCNSVALNSFFDNLGLNSKEYSLITARRSNASSPVYFDSSTSSVDSVGAGRSGGDNIQSNSTIDAPSIVERNARIIKWLCNCRKACERIHGGSNTVQFR